MKDISKECILYDQALSMYLLLGTWVVSVHIWVRLFVWIFSFILLYKNDVVILYHALLITLTCLICSYNPVSRSWEFLKVSFGQVSHFLFNPKWQNFSVYSAWLRFFHPTAWTHSQFCHFRLNKKCETWPKLTFENSQLLLTGF